MGVILFFLIKDWSLDVSALSQDWLFLSFQECGEVTAWTFDNHPFSNGPPHWTGDGRA
jgi:hypothetical protein